MKFFAIAVAFALATFAAAMPAANPEVYDVLFDSHFVLLLY
jgi:hypothetical protein